MVVLGWFLYVFVSPLSTLKNALPATIKSATEFDYEVVYSATGYSPNLLEVPVGSWVAFKNTTEIPMWTASDPHPVHTDFSEFDAQKEFSKNQSYVFQFNRPGTFSYHNHDKSIDRGIIRVTDKNNPLPQIDKTKESQRAVRNKLLAMLDQKDPESIFKMIDYIAKNPALAKDCHDVSHDLGHKAYELFGFSTAMTFNSPTHLGHTSVDDICAGGYMHGIMEELFLNQPELKNHLDTICSSIPIINRDSCYHGIGHSLMFISKRDVQGSLEGCRSINNTIYTRRCYEGVWMELFWGDTDHAGANSLGWDPQKPLDSCINAREDEKPDCFLYAHLGYLRTHPKDFAGVKDLCIKNGLDQWNTRYCLRGIGITMMKHFTSHHLELTESLVEGLGYWQKYSYYEGVIGYARLSSVSKKSLESFCGNLKTDTEVCLAVLNSGN